MVIFRGINLDYFSKKNLSEKKRIQLKSDWKINENFTKILLPGRLTSWKGQEKFIEALNILIEDYNNSNFQAIILGSDQGRKVYKKNLDLVQRYNLQRKFYLKRAIEKCQLLILYPISWYLAQYAPKPLEE